jgi:hypothetical protein
MAHSSLAPVTDDGTNATLPHSTRLRQPSSGAAGRALCYRPMST